MGKEQVNSDGTHHPNFLSGHDASAEITKHVEASNP